MNQIIEYKTFDQERALYHSKDLTLTHCTFAGPADGESVLKESSDIQLDHCRFSLRYPLWHVNGFSMFDTSMDKDTRAAIWYSSNGTIEKCTLHGIKAIRECRNIKVAHTEIDSPEFGWKSDGIDLFDCSLQSEYAFLDSRNIKTEKVNLKGKYAFQYCENVEVTDCDLDTKDAFWHSKNVTVRNSVIRGEYLGWFSEGLTLIDCDIIGTQPLCWCENLKLENCRMIDADLAFEYSDLTADIQGHVISIKNPKSGVITVDSVEEVITDNPTMTCTGQVVQRSKKD